MKYVLGIDSGGTKYLVRACAPDGKPLGAYTGRPAGHYRFPREEAARRMNESIDACLSTFGGQREDCAALVCGTTGIDTPEDERLVTALYRGLPGFSCPVRCVNDAQVALHAATGGVGAVVIAGTGSIAFGNDGAGKTARCGGFPPCIFGDDGSGTWVSRKALYHLSLWLDGRVAETPLVRLLTERLRVRTAHDLIALCIQIERETWENPGVGAWVDEAAAEGDVYARAILERAAQHTYALGAHVVTALGLQERAEFTVGAWGSALVKSPVHLEAFCALFAKHFPNALVRVAEEDAAMGACRMALAELESGGEMVR